MTLPSKPDVTGVYTNNYGGGSVGLPKATQMFLESKRYKANVSRVLSEKSAAKKDASKVAGAGSRDQPCLDPFSAVLTEYLSLRNA